MGGHGRHHPERPPPDRLSSPIPTAMHAAPSATDRPNRWMAGALLSGLLMSCSPGVPRLPGASLFATGPASAPGGDTGAALDDTGAPPTDTAAPGPPPWPTESDPGMSRGGASDCPNRMEPCNHEVRVAVGDGNGNWTVLTPAIAEPASVPHALILDHGMREGERWRSLWLTYVDTFPDHINPDAPNVLTTAIIPFTDTHAATPESFAALLSGEAGPQWVYKSTNTWELGYPLVDADREVFSDSPIVRSLDAVQHAMLVIDLDFETREDGLDNRMYVLGSDDGFTFERVSELTFDDIGTDPDCFPIGHTEDEEGDGDLADYPGVLPLRWAPGGTGRWGCNVTGLRRFYRTEGDLLTQSPTGAEVEGLAVTSTLVHGGVRTIWGHNKPALSADEEGPADLVRAVETGGGGFAEVETVLTAGGIPDTELGIEAPNVLPVSDGVELLVFHTLRLPL